MISIKFYYSKYGTNSMWLPPIVLSTRRRIGKLSVKLPQLLFIFQTCSNINKLLQRKILKKKNTRHEPPKLIARSHTRGAYKIAKLTRSRRPNTFSDLFYRSLIDL